MIEILLLIVMLKTNLFYVKFGSLKMGGNYLIKKEK